MFDGVEDVVDMIFVEVSLFGWGGIMVVCLSGLFVCKVVEVFVGFLLDV